MSHVVRSASPIGRSLNECRMKLSNDQMTQLGRWVIWSSSFDMGHLTFDNGIRGSKGTPGSIRDAARPWGQSVLHGARDRNRRREQRQPEKAIRPQTRRDPAD